jgi:hypothetical protein
LGFPSNSVACKNGVQAPFVDTDSHKCGQYERHRSQCGKNAASLLKKLHVPPRDAQMILGRAHISTTMQIYTHVDEEAHNDALAGLDKLLGGGQ